MAREKDEVIKVMEESLAKKEEEHEQLMMTHEEMRRNIAEMKRHAEVNPA